MKQLYKAVLGKANIDYYQNKFDKFDRKGKGLKVSWNWAALLFTGIWALYRKMYGWFFLFWFIGGPVEEPPKVFVLNYVPISTASATCFFIHHRNIGIWLKPVHILLP